MNFTSNKRKHKISSETLITSKMKFRYKARFVAEDFSHVFGKDFHETYSPTTRLSTITI